MINIKNTVLAAAMLGLSALTVPALAEGEYSPDLSTALNNTVLSSSYTGFGAQMPTATRMPPRSYDAVRDNPPGA